MIPAATAATKTAATPVKRLGFARWKRLHRLVYVSGGLGVLHFYLREKSDVSEPLVFGAVLAVFSGRRLSAGKNSGCISKILGGKSPRPDGIA